MALKPAVPRTPAIPVARVASPEDVTACPFWTLARLDGTSELDVVTRVRFAATEEAFVVLFESTAEPPLTIERGDGEEVFRDECVEIFLATAANPTVYDELVANPRGCLYTARIDNPDGSRATWVVSSGAPRTGISIDVEGSPASAAPKEWTTWKCRLVVPWTSLSSGLPPAPGEQRRGNAYRIARGRSTRFLALSPTRRSDPPDFHVPSLFARFVFGDRSA